YLGNLAGEDGFGDGDCLFKVLVRVVVLIPAGIEGADGSCQRMSAAGVVLQIKRLDKVLVKVCGFFADQRFSKLSPQQTKGGIRYAVFAHRCAALVVVKSSPADVKGKPVKAFGQAHHTFDLDVRYKQPQQRGGKHVVGMELACVGISNVRNLHHKKILPLSVRAVCFSDYSIKLAQIQKNIALCLSEKGERWYNITNKKG